MYLTDRLWLTSLFAKVALLALNPVDGLSLRAPNDTTASNDAPNCDSFSFGRPLLDSCRRAMEAIPDSTARVLTFGIRPQTRFISATVPYRVMGRES